MKRSSIPTALKALGWLAIVAGALAAFPTLDARPIDAITYVVGGLVAGVLLFALARIVFVLEDIREALIRVREFGDMRNVEASALTVLEQLAGIAPAAGPAREDETRAAVRQELGLR
jgi:hypothetical protein